MKTVIVDTNALMLPAQKGIDLENELTRLVGKCEITVPSIVVDEINNLAHREGKIRNDARVAQTLIKRFRIVKISGAGDQGIADYARKIRGIVVTNDKELKKELKDTEIPVIYLRGNNHLELNGWCE
jgi:rRNA-processing protein FCF1